MSAIETSKGTGSVLPDLIIYGATGYTGRLVSRYAKELGLKVMLASRNEAKLLELAVELDLVASPFDLESDSGDLYFRLGLKAVLNCAGPFEYTAKPLMEKCIKYGVHYLDISTELSSYRIAESLDKEAQAANVMLLPGCGGSVAMLDCLTQFVLDRNNEEISMYLTMSVDVALHIAGKMSVGSAITASMTAVEPRLQRRNGELAVWYDNEESPKFDFHNGKGPVHTLAVTMPDLITLHRSTGAPYIRTFVHLSNLYSAASVDMPVVQDGPSAAERAANPYYAVAAVTFDDGIVTRGVLHSTNGYTFASQASVLAAKRVISGTAQAGFQTPAQLFGAEFLRSVPGCTLMEG